MTDEQWMRERATDALRRLHAIPLDDPRCLRGRLEDLRQPGSHSEWTDERGPVTSALTREAEPCGGVAV